MNYEEKYKKALEKARAINDGKDVDIKAGTTVCEYIFPELAESEDEKIRKEIIDYIKTGTYHKSWITWLEKQGEQKPAWSEEDNNILNGITAYLSCTACNIEGFDRWYDWLKSLKSRVKPQWKPTDKQMHILWCHCSEGSLLLSLYNDLKKLKEDKV